MTRTELADAMLKGARTLGVEENPDYYIEMTERDGICLACALGMAFIGLHGGDARAAVQVYNGDRASRPGYGFNRLARLLDIPHTLASEIEHRHCDGYGVEEIAAWLKEGE